MKDKIKDCILFAYPKLFCDENNFKVEMNKVLHYLAGLEEMKCPTCGCTELLCGHSEGRRCSTMYNQEY